MLNECQLGGAKRVVLERLLSQLGILIIAAHACPRLAAPQSQLCQISPIMICRFELRKMRIGAFKEYQLLYLCFLPSSSSKPTALWRLLNLYMTTIRMH